ncbi:GNAT family N-acetyltransferase [Mangrovimicrobium sediminis]|uniref:GNAT family N-acetyltransferase n=1 Tax=Mangrovimicrobium sediminis TaxID=2562682 RepID=A0A4Z0LWZ6_9GAMM|nr:GNAT family N-acetyltransferase [Haliea sp. SAOS-164]TGD71744.1 GNAT family N-acetyltransferase [Haliea sp. SAOS-164]
MTPTLSLRQATPEDREAVREAYARSADLHRPWTYPPADLDSYLSDPHRYFLCPDGERELLGTFHLSGIVRGYFQSAYLGYEAFAPHQGKGYMRTGMSLLIREAFSVLKLHRLEANIQPENTASLRLAAGAGFVREGFSRHYLNVGNRGWRDHERWALLNDAWMDPISDALSPLPPDGQ